MKKTIITAIAAILAIVAFSQPAQAQFKYGPKVGATFNSLDEGKEIVNSSVCSGLTAGVMAEFTIPVVGLGVDASAMYTRRNIKADYIANGVPTTLKSHRDYIEIPVNLKFKLDLPVVGQYVKLMIFTGPSFAFLTSKRAINNVYKNSDMDCSWNFGLGVELFKKVQVAGTLGLGLNDTLEPVSEKPGNNTSVDGSKPLSWTVTAAYLF